MGVTRKNMDDMYRTEWVCNRYHTIYKKSTNSSRRNIPPRKVLRRNISVHCHALFDKLEASCYLLGGILLICLVEMIHLNKYILRPLLWFGSYNRIRFRISRINLWLFASKEVFKRVVWIYCCCCCSIYVWISIYFWESAKSWNDEWYYMELENKLRTVDRDPSFFAHLARSIIWPW